MAHSHSSTSALLRGLQLLELFTTADPELSLREMARRSGIPRSTTHRLARDLLEWGALERGKRGYRLGIRLFELGHLVPDQNRLREMAIPMAHSLSEITKLTTNL